MQKKYSAVLNAMYFKTSPRAWDEAHGYNPAGVLDMAGKKADYYIEKCIGNMDIVKAQTAK